DACVHGYHVPANALAAVSLHRLAALLDPVQDAALAADARTLAVEITTGIRRHGIVAGPVRNPIYAYEGDGLGGALRLDDATIPSLLALPYIGFCERSDQVYAATRSWLLGPANPNWASGRVVHGVGSGHTPRGWVWPLAVIAEGLTAADDDERESALR